MPDFFKQKSKYLGGGQSQVENLGDKLFGKLGEDLNRTAVNSESKNLENKVLGEVKKPGESLDLTGKTGEGFGVEQGLGIATGALSLLQNNKPKIDTSGNTNYGNTKGSDVGAGAMDIATDTLSTAAKGMAVGGPAGAIVGGILGLGKSIFQGAKQKRELNLAKERFQNKRRYQSEQAINKMTSQQRMNDIVGEENMDYVESLQKSPGYNRFKRNSQYNV